jgi:TonB family protein
LAHAVSASYLRSDRMSPAAVLLAILLHVLVVAAIWWLSKDRFDFSPGEDVVEVTLEQPAPEPEPPPPPTPIPQAAPPPPIDGLRPPAEITADKPTQVPQAEVSTAPPAPAPPPLREEAATPLAALLPPPPSELPTPSPQPQPAPQPSTEIPAPSPAQLPPTPAELAKPAPQPPPQPAPKVEQHALVAPPAPKPETRPSPLTMTPQRRPPAAPPAAEAPSQHSFVNPADSYNRARVSDNYLWQVARKLSGYQYYTRTTATEGLTVVRVVIARNGRLLDVTIVRSSGVPEFDQGVLAGVRSGSPYSPLPSDIKGDSATFTLPLVSSRR